MHAPGDAGHEGLAPPVAPPPCGPLARTLDVLLEPDRELVDVDHACATRWLVVVGRHCHLPSAWRVPTTTVCLWWSAVGGAGGAQSAHRCP